MSVDDVRQEVSRLTESVLPETRLERLMREQLERETGMPIAELAMVAETRWPR